ncbi:MAG TPA: DegQ family serine endoprotease [Synergistaceae bacterium]|nr:DegQ family serine endoprotease [Synergistaceae bacterium]HQF91501.1 DegQ family serine endoprotease [Synergistaceae bacterium]HQH78329.1 DegQ family serine endoprotease [Synergistaceae bacterium]HQK24711.1 DegQ family serine endoprotease [Synergistaceae bacterium]
MDRSGKWKVFVGVMVLGAILLGALSDARAQDVYTGNPVVKIAREAFPAVVNIDTEKMVTRTPFPFGDDPFFREFFGDQGRRFSDIVPMRGAGSGFLVTADGYILTNNHVVAEADKITVTLASGKEYPAKLVGRDPTFDLAVVKIDAKDLPVLSLGDSDKLEVGEWVAAIGNPFGLEHTITVGVISAKNRNIRAKDVNFQGFLQTDAAINPGNSGGPLLDLSGKVVGINTAIIPYAQGIGFAIPVNMAKQVMDDLVNFGKVRRGWLGIYLQPVTEEVAEAYGLKNTDGALVSDVQGDSPALRAGLQRGDVIVEIDGTSLKNYQDLSFAVRKHLAGDEVTLTVMRRGERKEIKVRLGELPGQVTGESPEGNAVEEKLGLAVAPVDGARRTKYNLGDHKGMVVTEVKRGTPAERLGIREGDLVLEANGVPVPDEAAWNKALGKAHKGVVLLILRDGRTFFISLRM